ncbi:hypothetical protein [Amycolatopsis thermoflava]|uniref:hypothetical protein n=1 Tax=Amycolatopsis thermoflava TaxID=84480 RepID=UPI0036618639
MNAGTVTFVPHAWSGWAILSPFAAKDVIKAWGGRWNPTDRVWTVSAFIVPMLADRLRSCGFVVEFPHGEPQPGASESSPLVRAATATPAPWTEAMFAALPGHLRKSAYRALAKVLHPDAGGDTALMRQLTDAYEKASTR